MLQALQGLEVYSGVKYWEYINVDALIGLQHPKTSLPDEMTFIVYHQICELYFKLIIHEISLIQKSYIEYNAIVQQEWVKRIKRISRYYELLSNSFKEVLSVSNLDTEEFFQFRMILVPASGFQTVQFRKIELMLTSLDNLTFGNQLMGKLGITLTTTELKSAYERVYWKLGARDKDTKEKTQLLTDFEEKYDYELINLSKSQKEINLNSIVSRVGGINDKLRQLLLQLNQDIVAWKKTHYEVLAPHFEDFKSLNQKYNWQVDESKGTGGTNFHKFLKASQEISYFKL